jgi:mono/diheme cytochrome c family protein
MTLHRVPVHPARVIALAAGALVLCLAPSAGAQGQSDAPQGGDKALIVQGEGIFTGKVAGGLCWTCHGLNAKGMKGLGPDLTDKTWLHGDGSVEFVKKTVKTGVPAPKKSATPMPPFGGIPLTDAQVEAVAAYVTSLSAGAKK